MNLERIQLVNILHMTNSKPMALMETHSTRSNTLCVLDGNVVTSIMGYVCEGLIMHVKYLKYSRHSRDTLDFTTYRYHFLRLLLTIILLPTLTPSPPSHHHIITLTPSPVPSTGHTDWLIVEGLPECGIVRESLSPSLSSAPDNSVSTETGKDLRDVGKKWRNQVSTLP